MIRLLFRPQIFPLSAIRPGQSHTRPQVTALSPLSLGGCRKKVRANSTWATEKDTPTVGAASAANRRNSPKASRPGDRSYGLRRPFAAASRAIGAALGL